MQYSDGMIIRHGLAAAFVIVVLSLGGCSSAVPVGESNVAESPSSSASAVEPSFIASLDELPGTEWTGLDESFNDRVTFIFNADGSLAYRTGEGSFAEAGDTWRVEGGVLTFQATYGERFGVGTHTGTYDPASGVLSVDYTTTTNRSSSYKLSKVD